MKSHRTSRTLGLQLFGLCLAVFLTWAGCNRQPTSWEADLALPLVDDLLDWSDVFADSTFITETGMPAVLAFNGSISDWTIDALTHLPDTIVSEDLTPDFVGGPFQVPPGTVLLDVQEDIDFQGIEQEFKYIRLESGRIAYSVESSTNGYVEIHYGFPSVTIGSQQVDLDVLLPPAASGDVQSETGIIDLAGAEIDLTGISGAEINRIASILTIGTPAYIPDTAQVFGSDSIRVRMHFQDLVVRQVSGYFGQELLDLDVDQPVFDPDIFLGGFIGLEPTRAMLVFHNTIGADLKLTVDALAVDGVALSHSQFGVPQMISRANWQGESMEPAIWEMNLLETSPSVFELLGYLPESISILGSAEMNPLGDVSGGNDFFDTHVSPEIHLDLEWPLQTTIENLRLNQVLEVDPISLPQFDGDVIVTVTNGFPVDLGLEIIWNFDDPTYAPVEVVGVVSAFDLNEGAASWEYRIPMDTEALYGGSRLDVTGSMSTEGEVVFNGLERMRIQVRIEGTYLVEIE
jgi:hypothetical protein